MRKWVWRLLLGGLVLCAASQSASANELLFRVVSERAEVRAGPGVAYRVVYGAERGEVMQGVQRGTSGYWFRVMLPDGTSGWILGDQVVPLEVDDAGPRDREPPSTSRIFAPSPLSTGRFGFTFSAGVLGGDGMFLFRPAFILESHIALEGFFGETVGDEVDVLYYGAGANAYLWPASSITPFFALGGGGATSRRKADQFTVREGTFGAMNVGGGLLIALKKRITLRADVRNHIVFDANDIQSAKEFSGGLVIVF